MRLLGQIVVIALAAIGGIAIIMLAFAVAAALSARPEPLPAHMVLTVGLDQGVVEARSTGALARYTGRKQIVLSEFVQTLDRASRDPRVGAIVARLDGAGMGLASAQEIRNAVMAFRKSGKRAVLYSEELGGEAGSSVDAYLASGFQEVWLQPSGMYGLPGYMAQAPFIKGTLDLLGVQPQFSGRWEYKSAIETFTHDKFSKEAKETLDALVQSWTKQTVEGIATARGLKPEDVRAAMDKGFLFADEAREAGLIDRVGYWDEVQKSLTDGGATMVDWAQYEARLGPQPEAVRVALIVGAGAVTSGGDEDGLGGAPTMSAGRITQALRDAAKDPTVKAILFRINSPGGSYTASDAIWREVGNARASGKPVVVSMGDVAASGGYFSAMAADSIVAQPATITGSIGVFAGKFVLADLWKKLGVSWDEVHQGENAGMWSENEPFTPGGWDRLNAMLDHVYADFTEKAGKARKLDAKAMDGVARGRVWPGDKAREIGLVDQLGGYPEAFVEIRRLARLPSQMPIKLVPFPHPRTTLEQVMQLVEKGELPEDVDASLAVEARMMQLVRPFAALLSSRDNTLLMPPIETR